MGWSHHERLSAVDTIFLEIEDANIHMHVGAVAIFDGAALRRADGSTDIDAIRRRTAAALESVPRFRQKLASVPLLRQPVWVDDRRFNLDYHVRHTALPPPGDVRQLKRLAGRIFSQKLDREKPLWEMWLVDGLSEDRFALVVKAHHCMVDGIAGVDLLRAVLSLEPEAALHRPKPWLPRPVPTATRMLRDETLHRAGLPLTLLREVPGALARPWSRLAALRDSALALGETIAAGLAPTTATALNVEIGPYRRFDWLQMELDQLKEIRKSLGGTLNDVVLAIVTGAIRRFLQRRGDPATPESVFRAMVPVSIRSEDQRGEPGNRIVNFLAELAVAEPDPRRRLERTIETMERLKSSRQIEGAEVLEEISDRTATGLLVQFVQLAARTRAYNLVVTNVPGPPKPVYLLDAPMREIYPLVPLYRGQALGIALFSYDGRLCWGFGADWDALPDLHDVVLAIDQEREELLRLSRRKR